MTRRKIDDVKLMELSKKVEAGEITQEDIAAYFGCSPAAVSKRIRLLSAHNALKGLTHQEQVFVLEKAKGRSNTAAARAAYECASIDSAKSLGHQVAQRADVQEAITTLMEHHGLTRSYRVLKLKEHVDSPDPGSSLRALEMSFKLADDFPANKNVNLNIDTLSLVKVDLSAYENPEPIPAQDEKEINLSENDGAAEEEI